MALGLDSPIQYIRGVGPKIGNIFRDHGIATVRDLLWNLPRTFEIQRVIHDVQPEHNDKVVQITGYIAGSHALHLGAGRMGHQISLKLDNGQALVKFFRAPFRGYFQKLQVGTMVHLTGKAQIEGAKLWLIHPNLEFIAQQTQSSEHFTPEDKIIPVYSEIGGLSSTKIGKIIQQAWSDLEDKESLDLIPQSLKEKFHLTSERTSARTSENSSELTSELISLATAIGEIHQPKITWPESWLGVGNPYRKRLAFEEFFNYQLGLAVSRLRRETTRSETLKLKDPSLLPAFIAQLPFALTGDQERVFSEIQADLALPHPMQRLLQGDVGSGKTVVSFLTAAHVIACGGQVAMMAPTEVLAEQHFLLAQKWLAPLLTPLGIHIDLLLGRASAVHRAALLAGTAKGQVGLLIGTHALLEDRVRFKKLQLVIIDEQHRFGVEQRGRLQAKSALAPHVLLMSATPIPRTLGLTLFGDLSISSLRQKPQGRQQIQTRATGWQNRDAAFDFVHKQVQKGRQAYIIYPQINESEIAAKEITQKTKKNLVKEFKVLQEKFPQVRVGLLHGQLSADEKEQVFSDFRAGNITILMSTTVIEVGVDVANANVILIEHAENFGMSQLHQLRGRVGRGEHKSYCILLLGPEASAEAMARAKFLETNTDGFAIAEKDLEMRGAGQFLGASQSGKSSFRVACLVHDKELLPAAKELADESLLLMAKEIRQNKKVTRLSPLQEKFIEIR